MNRENGCILEEVESIPTPYTNQQFERWSNTFTKLQVRLQ